MRAAAAHRTARRAANRAAETAHDPDGDEVEGTSAGAKTESLAHAARHVEFVRWLLRTYGAGALSSGSGVLDVAGGRGAVAFELQCRNNVSATLLEPREVTLTYRQKKLLRKQPAGSLGVYTHVRGVLDAAFAASEEVYLHMCVYMYRSIHQ